MIASRLDIIIIIRITSCIIHSLLKTPISLRKLHNSRSYYFLVCSLFYEFFFVNDVVCWYINPDLRLFCKSIRSCSKKTINLFDFGKKKKRKICNNKYPDINKLVIFVRSPPMYTTILLQFNIYIFYDSSHP